MKKILFVCVLLAILSMPGIAARSAISPYCQVIPNPVPLYSTYQVTGAGFKPLQPLTIFLTSPLGETYILNTFTDAQGVINQDAYINPEYGTKFNDELGTTNVRVYYGFGPTRQLRASCSFTVQ